MTKRLLFLLGLVPMLGFCAGIELFQTGPSATETLLLDGLAGHLVDYTNVEGRVTMLENQTNVWNNATTATKIHLEGDADYWVSVVGGTNWLWREEDVVTSEEGSNICVVATSGATYYGPVVGTVWRNPVTVGGTTTWDVVTTASGEATLVFYAAEPEYVLSWSKPGETQIATWNPVDYPFPRTLTNNLLGTSSTLDWRTPELTNTVVTGYPLAPLQAPLYDPYVSVPALSPTTTITPTTDASIYKVNLTTNTAIALNLSQLDFANQYATFEVEVTVPDAAKSFTLPGTNVVTYLDGLPDITTTVDRTKHFFVFRAMATNDIICNLWWTRTP